MNCRLGKGQDPPSERRHRSAGFVAVDALATKIEFPPSVSGNHRPNLQPTRTLELVRMDLNAATAGPHDSHRLMRALVGNGCWWRGNGRVPLNRLIVEALNALKVLGLVSAAADPPRLRKINREIANHATPHATKCKFKLCGEAGTGANFWGLQAAGRTMRAPCRWVPDARRRGSAKDAGIGLSDEGRHASGLDATKSAARSNC